MNSSLLGLDAPRVLSLFSGAGGLDLGLERAGFQHVGIVENDPIAALTLAANRPNWHMIGNGDVVRVANEISPTDLALHAGDLELLAGGPPCQPFSLAAQWAASGRKGMHDARADTVHATMSLVKKFVPKFILMENVLGFVQGKNSALEYLRNQLDTIGKTAHAKYVLHWKLVNAADFGVPQNRRRAIIVAARDDVDFAWPTPTHANSPLTAWDAIGDLPEPEDDLSAGGRWAPLLNCIPEGQNYQWLTSKGGGPEVFGYRTKYWNFLLKLSKSEPSWTLAATPGPSTGPFHWDNRKLSIREQLRIQSFPDDWTLEGNYRSQTRQAGNATPPALAEILGLAILSGLGQEVSNEASLTRIPLPNTPKPSKFDIKLPAQFLPLLGPKEAHAGTGKGPAPRATTPAT